MPLASPGLHLYFWLTSCKSGSPWPLPHVQYFARMAPKTQESSLLTRLPFIIRGYNLRGIRVNPCPLQPFLHVHQPRSPPNPIIQGFLWQEASSQSCDQLLGQCNLALLSSFEDGEWKWRSKLLILTWFFWWPAPHPWCHQESFELKSFLSVRKFQGI